MTRRVLEKLCTKKVCGDFLAPKFACKCDPSGDLSVPILGLWGRISVQHPVYIYIVVRLLSGPSLASLKVSIWVKFVFKHPFSKDTIKLGFSSCF